RLWRCGVFFGLERIVPRPWSSRFRRWFWARLWSWFRSRFRCGLISRLGLGWFSCGFRCSRFCCWLWCLSFRCLGFSWFSWFGRFGLGLRFRGRRLGRFGLLLFRCSRLFGLWFWRRLFGLRLSSWFLCWGCVLKFGTQAFHHGWFNSRGR